MQVFAGHAALLGWYSQLSVQWRAVLSVVLGAVAAFGQAPYGQPLVLVLGFACAFLMLRHQRQARVAGFIGWCFGCGYFGHALFWILEPFQIDPEQHAWMAPFALVFMCMGLAIFWGAAFWLARRLSSRSWPLILTWTVAEIMRAYVLTGFPWAGPAQALIDSAAGQGLAWAGPHGMALWLMSLAWVFALPVVHSKRHLMRSGQLALLCMTVALFHLPPSAPPSALKDHWVRIVQPNAEQHLKWQPEFAQSFFQRQLDFTAAAPEVGDPAPSLTVWPETAIPWVLDRAEPALRQISDAALGEQVALGALRRAENEVYNSLILLGEAGVPEQIYDKRHLVPFGEYIPFRAFFSQFGIKGLAQQSAVGFASGKEPSLMDFGALGRGLPLICYEAVFAHEVNSAPARPEFLLQITNDAWFGQNAGPQQHLAQARMRAIEQGLPVIRAANTGISAMIDPKGRVLESLAMNVAGYFDTPLPRPDEATLYHRTGDWPVVFLTCLGLFGATFNRHRRRETD